MKKQLLLGTALLAAVSAISQTSGKTRVYKEYNLADRLSSKYATNNPVENAPSAEIKSVQGPEYQAQGNNAAKGAAITWKYLSGSMNIYGMLVNNTKPLRYYPDINAISFVHRKSATYALPVVHTATAANTGAIVAMISNDIAGNTWDSTCVWDNATQWARYPQGGIYHTPGNNNLSQAYVVATGPLTSQANSWVGSFLASKSLATYNNAASTASNAQQFIANTPPYGNTGKVDFPRYDFSVTDDGLIRSIGTINNNINGTGAAYGLRGARVLKGQFNSGTMTFDWSGDSIIPPAAANVNGVALWGTPHMCWNKTGTVGYVWFIGLRTGASNSNKGYQPIVFKTTNSGQTWAEIPGINFNSPGAAGSGMSRLLSRLDTVPGTSYVAPQFNVNEGMDGIVDANNKLHIVSTVISTIKSHEDSLLYYRLYQNTDGESYRYEYDNDRFPYIYDFTEGAAPGQWNVTEIDILSTEGPGERPGDAGFNANPWDATGGSGNTDKVSSDARIQLSSSDDGKYIIYTWAESDVNVTASGLKWNNVPNIKARAAEIQVLGNGNSFIALSPTEVNVSDPPTGGNVLVKDNAQMFYVSPRAKVTSTIGDDFVLTCPFTVSNSSPLTQLLPNKHWFTSADLSFKKYGIGIAENALASVNNSVVYPNPAAGNAFVSLNLKENSKVDVKVMNLVGALVKSTSVDATAGDNTVSVDLSGLASGVYMVNVRVGEASSTKKIIVQ